MYGAPNAAVRDPKAPSTNRSPASPRAPAGSATPRAPPGALHSAVTSAGAARSGGVVSATTTASALKEEIFPTTAQIRKGHRLFARWVTTVLSSPSSAEARSGRGSRKSSKSAAEKVSISPAPFIRSQSSPAPGLVISSR